MYIIEGRGVLIKEEAFANFDIASGFSKQKDYEKRSDCTSVRSVVMRLEGKKDAVQFFEDHYSESQSCWISEPDMITHFGWNREAPEGGVLILEYFLVDTKTDEELLMSDTSYKIFRNNELIGVASDCKGVNELLDVFCMDDKTVIRITLAGICLYNSEWNIKQR